MLSSFKLNEISFCPELGADLTTAYRENWFSNPGFGAWLHSQTQITSMIATNLDNRSDTDALRQLSSQKLRILLALNTALKEHILAVN